MGDSDNRQITRDSLFIMAELRLDGQDTEHRVKVRNLSSGGLMAESDLRVARGTVVWISLRNVGWIEGSVAWIQENRFGIAFRDEVDSRIVRANQVAQQMPDAMILPRRFAAPLAPDAGKVRKIL
jgi:hypothetical protein